MTQVTAPRDQRPERLETAEWSRFDVRWIGWLLRLARDLTPAILLYIGASWYRTWRPEFAPTAGERHAADVMAFQSAVGIDVEGRLQQALEGEPNLLHVLGWFYAAGWGPIMVLTLALAFFRAPALLDRWRPVVVVSATVTAAVQAVYPLAPPRLYEPSGLIDTLATYGPTYYRSADDGGGFVNTYGAMPSMHVGWAAVAASLLWALGPRRVWLAILLVAYVLTMAVVVVATGNHWVIDIVAGLAVVGSSALLGVGWSRWRSRPRDASTRREPLVEPEPPPA